MADGLAAVAFTPAQRERLAAVADVVDADRGDDVDVEADVVLGHWGCPRFDADALEALPRLRFLAYAAGTVRDVVTPDLWARGITVTSAAAANAVPVAEYTLAAILFANKGVFASRERLRDPALRIRRPRPVGNLGKRVGLVGASLVGRRVIELLAPFDLEVAVSDPYLTADEAARLGVVAVDLDEMMATSAVVSIHAPDLPSTRHLVGAAQLALLADGATLVNTARPALVDQDALEAELRTGRISAVLDVTDPDPLPPGHPLLELPNVFATPHVAGAQGSELQRLADLAITEIERYAAGEPPLHPVVEADLGRIA
jgi:phosphoglycerate dehydrogenase-like enzyme